MIDALGDGRLVVWNGEHGYVQSVPGATDFGLGHGLRWRSGVYGGVAGRRHTLLLGAGYSEELYRFDVTTRRTMGRNRCVQPRGPLFGACS